MSEKSVELTHCGEPIGHTRRISCLLSTVVQYNTEIQDIFGCTAIELIIGVTTYNDPTKLKDLYFILLPIVKALCQHAAASEPLDLTDIEPVTDDLDVYIEEFCERSFTKGSSKGSSRKTRQKTSKREQPPIVNEDSIEILIDQDNAIGNESPERHATAQQEQVQDFSLFDSNSSTTIKCVAIQ